MGIGYVVGVLGGAILAHAAYATIQCTLHPSPIPSHPLAALPPKFAVDLRFPKAPLIFHLILDCGQWWTLGSSLLWHPQRSQIERVVEALVNWGGV